MDSENFRSQPKQKRGQVRVDAILNAASEVFAEMGYDNAPITRIAAHANTSVGSLYQFFANKEAILKALVERYVARATVVFAGMNVEAYADMSVETSVKALLMPLKSFIKDNRDFQVIFSNSLSSSYVAEAIRDMDQAFLARNDAAIAAAQPHLTEHERRKYSLVCMVIMKAMLSLARPESGLTLDEVFEELEAVYVRYLQPIAGEQA